MARLADAGAQAIVPGCTEISLLAGSQDSPLPLLDTTALHALAAVDFALQTGDSGTRFGHAIRRSVKHMGGHREGRR
ncbi:hypothetical protein AB870_02155 [Pandoraea faecigallinarum]|uniref:Aspartate racemase n=1 Tax=Pandoraea faecigallinarum TaxID=656179 RepID=A0A0H3WRJ8_9BURK|nr:hypothetical protein AB870_02155 [Pandoraea faecigallinarum]